MKKVLIVSALFPPEPVVSAKISEDLAKKLAELCIVNVIAPYPTRPLGFNFQYPKNENYDFEFEYLNSYRCPESSFTGRFLESYSFGKACAKYIKLHNKRIDLIYMNTWPILAQYLTINAAKRYNIPVITHIQDIYPESLFIKIPRFSFVLKFLIYPIDKIILKKSKKIIAISERMKSHLAITRDISKNKIEVIQNWQNEKNFIRNKQIKDTGQKQSFTFMYLGNIGPVAGIDLLIKSFQKANLKGSKLVIAGSGSKKKELINMVSSKKVKGVFFKNVPDGEEFRTQEQADIMLLPVKRNAALSSIPSKLPSYMFSKKPIIASVDLNSDIAKAIKNSSSGWVVEPESTNTLASAMIEAHSTHKFDLIEKGNSGYNYAIENFSKSKQLNKLIKVILK